MHLKVHIYIYIITRPKPAEHGYVFSMAVINFGEWLKLVPFFVRGRKVDWGGGQIFKINILAVKYRQTPYNKYSGLGP